MIGKSMGRLNELMKKGKWCLLFIIATAIIWMLSQKLLNRESQPDMQVEVKEKKEELDNNISYGVPLSEIADKIEQVYLYANTFDNVSKNEFGDLGALASKEAVRASIYLLEGSKILFLPKDRENTQVPFNGKTYGMHYSKDRGGYLFYIVKDWRLVESSVPINSTESSCIQYCSVKEYNEGEVAKSLESVKPFIPDYDGEYAFGDLAYLGEVELNLPADKLAKAPLVDLDNNEYIDAVISYIADELREKGKCGNYEIRLGEYRRTFDRYDETTLGYVTTVITGNGLKEYAFFEVVDNGNGYSAFLAYPPRLENSPFLFMDSKYDEDIVRKVEMIREDVIYLEVKEDSVSVPEINVSSYDEEYFDFRIMEPNEITDMVENVLCYCNWFGMYELGYQEGKLRKLNQEEIIVYSWDNTGRELLFIPKKMVNLEIEGKNGQKYSIYVYKNGEIEFYILESNPYAEKKGQLKTTYVSHDTFGTIENNSVEYLTKLGDIHINIDVSRAPAVEPVEADDEYIRALKDHIKKLLEKEQKKGEYEIYLGEYEALHTNKVCVSASVVGGEEEYYMRYLIVRSETGKYYFWSVGFGLDDSLEECKSTVHQMNKRCIEKTKYLNRKLGTISI